MIHGSWPRYGFVFRGRKGLEYKVCPSILILLKFIFYDPTPPYHVYIHFAWLLSLFLQENETVLSIPTDDLKLQHTSPSRSFPSTLTEFVFYLEPFILLIPVVTLHCPFFPTPNTGFLGLCKQTWKTPSLVTYKNP